jgi:hypothetical protein
MEFFNIINTRTTEAEIQKNITFEDLEKYCVSIFTIKINNNKADIGTYWGEFTLQKDNIKGGLRFSLLECPNALAFTITTGLLPEPDKIIFHLTVNKLELTPVFIEEIEVFIEEWKVGIKENFNV